MDAMPEPRPKTYCGRCNAPIAGQVFQCCEIFLHGACFTNHRLRDHARMIS